MRSEKWELSAYDGPEKSPGFRFWKSFLNWQQQLNVLLKPIGLTQPQFSILAICGWLTHEDKLVTQQNISTFTDMDRMHISQIICRLESKGFIEKKINPQDLRTNSIRLTSFGQQQLSLAIPIVEKFDHVFFENTPNIAE